MDKKSYTKPALTVVSFRAEKGYLSSITAFTPLNIVGMIELIKSEDATPPLYRETESFNTRSGWDSDHQSAFWE